MGIDGVGPNRTQHIGDILRHAGIEPGGGDAKAHCLTLADQIDRQHSAAGNRLLRNHQQVEQEFDPVLRQQKRAANSRRA